MSVTKMFEQCPGDMLNNYKCIRGKLFEPNIVSGGWTFVRDCEKCAGTEVPEPKKVVRMPNEPIEAPPEGVRMVSTNAMGHQRLPLTPKHEALIQRIRDVGLELYVLLHEAGGTDPNQDRFANRNLAIAATDLEAVIMRAVRGVGDRK